MKETRFRAWHKQERKMYLPNYLHFSPDGKLFGILVKEGELLDENEFELLEYVGLKDKNGKEIFEGDILTDGTYRIVIRWYQSDCCYMAIDIEEYPKDEPTYRTDNVWVTKEIIGNIYEYPELLGASKTS